MRRVRWAFLTKEKKGNMMKVLQKDSRGSRVEYKQWDSKRGVRTPQGRVLLFETLYNNRVKDPKTPPANG